MTISSSELKKNMTLVLNDELFQLIEWQHRKPPKAPPTLTLKVKSLKHGNILEKKIQGNRPIKIARTEKKEFQYLFEASNFYTFMDTSTFEQINLTNEFLGDSLKFVEEGQYIEILMHENNPISVEMAASVSLVVTSTEEAVRGDTATNITKTAVLSTGLEVQVPLFIKAENKIKVDTRTGSYIERVSS